MTEIRNILFDLGNVLFDIDIPGATKRLLAFLHPDIPAPKALRVITELAHRYDKGTIETADFITGILKQARDAVTEDDIITAWNSMLIGMPAYRLSMLEALKENYTVLLLSNINPLHLDWVRQYMHSIHNAISFESHYFHGVYYSYCIGYRKPEEKAFHAVIEDSYITPARTLFIDDMAKNIRAAKRLGFQTRLVRPGEEIAEVLKLKGYY